MVRSATSEGDSICSCNGIERNWFFLGLLGEYSVRRNVAGSIYIRPERPRAEPIHLDPPIRAPEPTSGLRSTKIPFTYTSGPTCQWLDVKLLRDTAIAAMATAGAAAVANAAAIRLWFYHAQLL